MPITLLIMSVAFRALYFQDEDPQPTICHPEQIPTLAPKSLLFHPIHLCLMKRPLGTTGPRFPLQPFLDFISFSSLNNQRIIVE